MEKELSMPGLPGVVVDLDCGHAWLLDLPADFCLSKFTALELDSEMELDLKLEFNSPLGTGLL